MTSTATAVRPPGLPQPSVAVPSLGDWVALAGAAAAGSIALLPLLAAIWLYVAPTVAIIAWVCWLLLAAPFVRRDLADALGRSIAGWRPPNEEEFEILRTALLRVCISSGSDPEGFTVRVARGRWNAHSSGRSVLAATADVITGPESVDRIELEAMLAHELAHHRHGDLILAGPRWWLLLPLAVVDGVCRVLWRLPVIGPTLARLIWLPFRVILFPSRVVSSIASRPRELLADGFSVNCGYAIPLERVFERFAGQDRTWPGGLVEWMLNTHPDATDRIAHLRNAETAVAHALSRQGL